MKLRAYQQDLFNQVISSNTNDLVQLDTGAGKTPIIAKLAQYYPHVLIVCHRNILLKQASEKLALNGVQHKIIASNALKKIAATNNLNVAGAHFINAASSVVLASIDTLNSKIKRNENPLQLDIKWLMLLDEAHHFAEDNKWQALQQLLECRVVGFTATPIRSDGQPMLQEFGGFFDNILQAHGYEHNATELLIAQGWLCPYVAYFYKKLVDKRDENYKLALGADVLQLIKTKCQNRKNLVIFPRIELANEFILQAKKAKHRAAVIHSGLPQYEILRILDAYQASKINTLAAVDMVNEGFDLPAVDTLILCRNVRSFGFYRQICGRVLRPAHGKTAVIYDLSGECIPRHGLPSDPINWNLQQIDQVQKNLAICPHCDAYIKMHYNVCPHCDAKLDKRSKNHSSLTIEQYISTLQQVYRQQVSDIERELLKKQQLERELKQRNTEYLNHKIYVANTLVGNKCEYFFNNLKRELKFLKCSDYNNFFIENSDIFSNLANYIGIMTADFDNKKTEQCRLFYEKYKSDK